MVSMGGVYDGEKISFLLPLWSLPVVDEGDGCVDISTYRSVRLAGLGIDNGYPRFSQ